jgi:hypothetical protein
MLHEGRNNPAALDLRPPMLTMSLAVQHRASESTPGAWGWTLFTGEFIESMMSTSDSRLFTVAVEDVSNALLYAQSLSRLGRLVGPRRSGAAGAQKKMGRKTSARQVEARALG